MREPDTPATVLVSVTEATEVCPILDLFAHGRHNGSDADPVSLGPGAYAPRDSFPTELPTRPPYTAHLGNLSYDATQEAVTEFFAHCDITSVRIIEDRIEQRPKGFAYAEFADVEGLKKALDLDGESFQGRTIKVRIADPRKSTTLNTLLL